MEFFIIAFSRTGFDIDHVNNLFDTREEANDAGWEFVEACDKIGLIDPPTFNVHSIDVDETAHM